MSNPWIVLVTTIVLIAASAFFVAVEFALIAARRHRLEDMAPTSRSARAAVRSASELSVLLAGSQLGITLCTLALGAITKPAVHYFLTPTFLSWGAPSWLADIAGFVLALIIVTFLHLVVGEMAPKSWAIAHPERSAVMLAIPMRAFMWITRPLLRTLNAVANWCLVKIGVEPVDSVAAGRDSKALHQLVDHSATVGSLDDRYHGNLSSALALESLTVGDITRPNANPSSVPADATVDDIRDAAHRSGHLRLLVRSGEPGNDVVGVVHVRDVIQSPSGSLARDVMREVFTVGAQTPVYEALADMRSTRSHLAVVQDHPSQIVGVITLSDVLTRILPGVVEV